MNYPLNVSVSIYRQITGMNVFHQPVGSAARDLPCKHLKPQEIAAFH